MGRRLWAGCIAWAWVTACGGEAVSPPPPPPPPLLVAEAEAEPAPVELGPEQDSAPALSEAGFAEPDEARAGPLRARIAADPSDASARCELAWLYFGVGNTARAEAEALRAIATLDASVAGRVPDASTRRQLGACLYNMGRVHELRGQGDEALARYARSLWYREDSTVRERWQSYSATLPGEHERPLSPPAALWTFARDREAELCELGDEGAAELTLGADSTEGDCGIEIAAYVRNGPRMAAVLAHSTRDDMGTPYLESDDDGEVVYSLATGRGSAWTMRSESLFVAPQGGARSSVEDVSLRIRDLQPGGELEYVASIESSWSEEGEYDTVDGADGEVILCGEHGETTTFVCAHVTTLTEYNSYGPQSGDESVSERAEVLFRAGGVVRIRGRQGGERVREETTVAALWQAELDRAAAAAARAEATAREAAAREAAAREAPATLPVPVVSVTSMPRPVPAAAPSRPVPVPSAP